MILSIITSYNFETVVISLTNSTGTTVVSPVLEKRIDNEQRTTRHAEPNVHDKRKLPKGINDQLEIQNHSK